jgi:hypothetical protein
MVNVSQRSFSRELDEHWAHYRDACLRVLEEEAIQNVDETVAEEHGFTDNLLNLW